MIPQNPDWPAYLTGPPPASLQIDDDQLRRRAQEHIDQLPEEIRSFLEPMVIDCRARLDIEDRGMVQIQVRVEDRPWTILGIVPWRHVIDWSNN